MVLHAISGDEEHTFYICFHSCLGMQLCEIIISCSSPRLFVSGESR